MQGAQTGGGLRRPGTVRGKRQWLGNVGKRGSVWEARGGGTWRSPEWRPQSREVGRAAPRCLAGEHPRGIEMRPGRLPICECLFPPATPLCTVGWGVY